MGSRQKRSKIANLLFAGGGITAAALLAQYQLGRAPEEVTFQSTDGLTQAVTESLQVDTPELPVVPVRYKKPRIADRDVFVDQIIQDTIRDSRPMISGRMAIPNGKHKCGTEDVQQIPDAVPGKMVLPRHKD